MILVRASSTARVTERQSEAEKPSTSVKRSSAPRTTHSSLGSLCSCSLSSKPSCNAGRPFRSGCREDFVFMCDWDPPESGQEHKLEWQKREGRTGGPQPQVGISTTLKHAVPGCRI